MTLLKLIRNDLSFQYRYGFFYLYGFFTIFYLSVLYFMPEQWKATASVIIVISDPILIGLVFMGAFVLFEKSERVLHSIAVSPISSIEYTLSKTLSISMIGLLSAVIIVYTGREVPSVLTLSIGLALGSILFSLMGLAISTTVHTLNNFIIKMLPAMFFASIPMILYAVDVWHWSLELHPSTSVINLLNDHPERSVHSVAVLVLWNVVMFMITHRRVAKMFTNLNAIKL